MKIEKINERQIKFILTNSDLVEHGIKVSEFIYGAEKTHELFRGMLEQAMKECDFCIDNTPLVIEAMPISIDSISITVTKISEALDIQSKLSNLLAHVTEDLQKIRKRPLINTTEVSNCDNILIYSFDNLDHVVALSSRIHNIFIGESSLYKNNTRYYLVLEPGAANEHNALDIKELHCILNEYGQKHISSELAKHYLIEHGELIIYSNALHILVKYL